MYFSKFPYIDYLFPDGQSRSYKNISIRPHIIEKVKEFETNLFPYTVKEGEMPDHIAYDQYGNSKYHWIVMLFNDTLNLHTDWPKSPGQFNSFLKEKYTPQETNLGTKINLTELELQRFVEFAGTPANNYESKILIDSDRNGFLIDSDGALGDSDEYITLRPKHIKWTPKDDAYPNLEFEDVFLAPEVYKEREDYWGTPQIYEGVLIPVSYYEYEFELNEVKRRIKLPRREVVNKLIDEFPELIKQ